jgi:2-oxoglutarate/2-oxoacid ferredoxin oxidoreductase subunit alpha
MDTNVRIAGEAGQGVQTVGLLLVEALAGAGLHVFSTQSYLSRVRGGLNSFDIRVGDRELFSGREQADLLVALSDEALDALGPEVSGDGRIFAKDCDCANGVAIDFVAEAQEAGGTPLMAGSVAAGAVFARLGCDIEALCARIGVIFKKKGLADENVDCARRGYALAGAASSTPSAGAQTQTYNGSAVVGLGAATAGVKLVSSYPMTPSTGVFTFLAAAADEYGIVVEQAEDEIAAINMVCGACYAGAPAMTTTSGGGFALMAEGLSLAGMMELPAFILLSQRPGPATGLPTRTGQEDLKFVVNAGHGEFARAVYAPGSLQEAYDLTRRALATAHKFQTPVVLLIDQFLADLRTNMPELDRQLRPIDRCIVADPSTDYVRYADSPDGVSQRAVPGGDVFVISDSDEHTADGHLTEDLTVRVQMQDKRLRKVAGLQRDVLPPVRYGPADARWLLISWGSTCGPCRDAIALLAAQNQSVALLHFGQVWPLNAELARQAIGLDGDRPGRIVCVEGNATGQFASLLREQGVLPDCELLLKYDGLPFTGEEIARRLMP